jgi:hypothetical protein
MSLLWERHLKRMDNKEMHKKIKDSKLKWSSRAGRPKPGR